MNIDKKLALGLLLLLLSGCASAPPVPEDRFYRLPEPVVQSSFKQPIIKRIIVGPLRANGIYNERAMLYINMQKPLQVMRYHYHYWLQSPAHLIQENLSAYLQKTGIASEVLPYGTVTDSKYRVYGTLLRFERLLQPRGVTVIARVTFTLEKSGNPVFTRVYEVKQKTADDSMHASAVAMGKTLSRIYGQLFSDIQQQLKPASQAQ